MSMSSLALPLLLFVSAPEPVPVAPAADAAYAHRVNRAARGVGIGSTQGVWGLGFGQQLHLDLPFGRRVGQFVGLRLQGTIVHPVWWFDRGDFVAFGGAELFGRSPVVGGIVRVYGGGGLFVGGRPRPTHESRAFGIAGGGHAGIEAFMTPRLSFSVEVGGQGPVHALGLDAGVRAMGGVNIYLGRIR